MLIIKLVGNLL